MKNSGKIIIGDIFQCALATISVFIVMMVLDVVTKAVIIAAFGIKYLYSIHNA